MTSRKKDSRANFKIGNMLSVVIPAFNEELVLKETIKRVKNELVKFRIEHEIIVVNDGSTDSTLELCRRLQQEYKIRIINLSRNLGHMAAITAGLEASNGEFVATMDADLQDPPEDLASMYDIIYQNNYKSDEKIDVIQAFRKDRTTDSKLKCFTAAVYYKLIEKLTGIQLIHHAADFRIMKREVVNALLDLPEKNRIYRLLIPKLGFNVEPYAITRHQRFAGETKYSKQKMAQLALDSVFAFSYKPIRFFSYLGFISSIVLLVSSLITLIISLIYNTVPGWPSIALFILGINTFLFAGLGIIGEYVGRIYELVQARPATKWREL